MVCRDSQAAERGADAVLVVTPAYVKPSQQGLVAFYTMVADKGGLPVILYNVSGSWCHPVYSTILSENVRTGLIMM